MDIFKNAERSVSSYTFNKKDIRKIDMVSDAYVGNEALRRIEAEKKAVKEAAVIEAELAHDEENRRVEKVVHHSMTESRILNRMNQLSAHGKTELFKSILFETLYCSLPIDNDFLYEHSTNIKAVIDDYVDNNGGFNKLVESAQSTGSELLKRMKTLCEATAKEVCQRKMSELKTAQDPNLINFDMTEAEKDTFNYNVKDLSIDQLAKLIKDKVITVINDSKKREAKNAEIIEEIENDLKANDEVTDEKSLKEAFDNLVITSTPIEHATLFNALVRSTYRDILTENVAITSTDKNNADEDREISAGYDTDATMSDIDDGDTIDSVDAEHELSNIEIDMDTILTEAITKYTLMEMVYTLKLENYTSEDIRKMTEKMVNPR